MKNNFTLLYVEDEPIVRESFTEIFKTYFTHVISAENGLDGLKLYQENEIDIAILDIALPDMDGLTLAKKIREFDKDTEIIMLTGHAEKDKLLQAINLHLFYYLMKPVKKLILDETLHRLIEKLSQKSTINFANNYSFNSKEKILYYKKEKIRLSKNETKLLTFLCKSIDAHHSACDISTYIFDELITDDICNNSIQLISRLKKKMLDLHPEENFFIDNIYGLGYKIRR